ncbi:DEAD/DEAH box helicase [Sphingomonas sp. Leaf339]|uniref:helicase-related protein n=1 Tax=Sphingomonas sp. Leaf339 TaxID=1736343 RepID=UPI0006F824C4|nr:helicase-related protein [Sphingomonas sp. Leaf339]KQU45971.1 DEAD/DEAH box helicase [Sphingomonas sp. Leaf339]
MLKRTPDTVLPGEAVATADAIAAIAARVALRDDRRVMLVAQDGQRGEAIAKAVAAFAPDAVVVHLISSDALPGEAAPPSAGNVGRRVAALRQLRLAETEGMDTRIVVILSADASAVRYPAPAAFDEQPPAFAIGDAIDIDAFPALAESLGYTNDDRVDEPGEIALRGTVIDIFPADRTTPARIEFADGVVTGLRAYDPVTQLGIEAIDSVVIGRASEPALGAGGGKGVAITDHLPDAAILIEPAAIDRRNRFLALAGDGAPRRRIAAELVDAKALDKAVADRLVILDWETDAAPPRFVERTDPVRAFRRFAKAALAEGRLVLAGSPRDLSFLASRIGTPATPVASLAEAMATPVGTLSLLAAPVERGFTIDDAVVVAAADLLGSRAQGDDAPTTIGAGFAQGTELHIGDIVVHEDHGIGSVVGLETQETGDHIVLEYAKAARRLVPVEEANRIWRYGADRDAVTLDTLDGASWIKRRAAIDAAIAESARTLASLAAEREARTVDPIVPDNAAYERFAAGFPFTETADQARAIAAVRSDLASGRAMDRLVVGDVGYGKTEVALRAAALVALSGRQVAIVAPTTVLVRQHLDTIRRRFAGIEVAALSRLSTPAERKRVCAGLVDGTIHVVVGTAAVAAKSVRYADLALVVIDEEQRFGAAAKASLRDLGAGHVLTLSATPIPRTLQSALVGLQAISVIATPPARRQPIRTTVAPFADDDVRKALLRERASGGQSFVVVPRIEDIDAMAATLRRLVPALGLVVAHGRMGAGELDEAMAGFAAGDGDVLLATNIIEAGLDVPRANTMIVHHADRFGLSQLHQLRGRVGRGGRRGQIMLTTDGDATIAEATLKRLRTLQALDHLGAGFAISARDLDMRGAGDLIGEEQAGHMKLIGIDLYQHLLGHALQAARGEAADRWQPTLSLGAAGRLPDDWIPEPDLRLSLYGELAHLDGVGAIDRFQAELEDRFGPMPAPAVRLLDTACIAALAASAGVRQIDAGPAAIALTLADPKATLPAPFEQVKNRWLLRERIDDPATRIERLRDVLDELRGDG